MVILLLCGVWIIAIAIGACHFLVKALKTGVFIGRSRVGYRSVRVERRRSPRAYWYNVILMAVIVGVALYFGLMMVLSALSFAVEG